VVGVVAGATDVFGEAVVDTPVVGEVPMEPFGGESSPLVRTATRTMAPTARTATAATTIGRRRRGAFTSSVT
jgi:hypothetical protein